MKKAAIPSCGNKNGPMAFTVDAALIRNEVFNKEALDKFTYSFIVFMKFYTVLRSLRRKGSEYCFPFYLGNYEILIKQRACIAFTETPFSAKSNAVAFITRLGLIFETFAKRPPVIDC